MTVPFVVVHGALLWKLSLVVITGGVLVVVALVRRLMTRSAMWAELDSLERRTDPGLVRGTLGGGGDAATVVAFALERGRTELDHRGETLWIETADGKVTLEGAVRVVAGSHASAARRRAPAGTPAGLVPADLRMTRATLARVAPGDEVIAFGQLETVAGNDETDNRTNASARVLRPVGDTPIKLAAQQPRSAAPRSSVFALLLIVTATPLIAWKIEGVLGESWRQACWRVPEPDGERPLELSNTSSCALATAMPGSRENALDRIVELAQRDPYRDRATLDRLVDLAKLTGNCPSTLNELRQAERTEEVLEIARQCGDRRSEHIALLELGRFEEAAAIAVPAVDNGEYGSLAALPNTPTLILGGRWADAATAADARAAAIRTSTHKPEEQASIDMTALSYRCLGELLRHHAGDAGALARLRGLAAGQYGGVCAPALAQAVPEAEVAGVLATRDVPLLDAKMLLRKLRVDSGEGFEATAAESVLSQPDDMGPAMEGSSIWLAATAPPLATDAPASARVRIERWQAVAATLGGDLAAARQHAARAIAAAPDADVRDQYDVRYVDTLPAVIELYSSGPVTYTIPDGEPFVRDLWLHNFGRLLLRRGEPLVKGTYFGPQKEYAQALEQAAAGDGRALARHMGSHGLTWWNDTDIMAVLPRVKLGREALARQLAWSSPQDHMRLDFHFPWSVALHAAARRASLHLAGADAEAARWGEIYKRYDQTLRDRRKLIALVLWEL